MRVLQCVLQRAVLQCVLQCMLSFERVVVQLALRCVGVRVGVYVRGGNYRWGGCFSQCVLQCVLQSVLSFGRVIIYKSAHRIRIRFFLLAHLLELCVLQCVVLQCVL